MCVYMMCTHTHTYMYSYSLFAHALLTFLQSTRTLVDFIGRSPQCIGILNSQIPRTGNSKGKPVHRTCTTLNVAVESH